MNIAIIGGAGFIGVNLAIRLSSFPDNRITVVDRDESFFEPLRKLNLSNVAF